MIRPRPVLAVLVLACAVLAEGTISLQSNRRLLQDGAIARTVSEDGTAVSLENNPVILASTEEATNDVIFRASLSNVADTSVEAANGGVARFSPFRNSLGVFDNTRPILNFLISLFGG
ncbi:hypothetical protein BSKO_10444 [Bryopsis sp. KO-2023]|nr:hypothetical protein BSKO_10444 [Bryopsis sp. KO-2023]